MITALNLLQPDRAAGVRGGEAEMLARHPLLQARPPGPRLPAARLQLLRVLGAAAEPRPGAALGGPALHGLRHRRRRRQQQQRGRRRRR